MPSMKPIILLPLLLLSLPAAAVFKCQSPDGKVAFQETPCANAEKQSDVRTFAAPSPSPATAQDMRSPADRSAINVAILQGHPVRGMTLKELQSAMGAPTRINTGDYPGGFTEQRIYERDNGTFYVYTESGVVRSIQTSAAIARTPSQQARACPSEFDIKNEEVSANSISLTEPQRRDKQRKIADMRACR
ncbi:DUF4124 domain-containing protein [Acidovorax cavernicola]|uniref:DUF4124 domain-containing protein n=2 Tax=Acidovorax cavernicola TaxID=1675792 RepID=A0A9X8GVI3_9BURK|nr:DUF4124 domain-containing protein [Acidovorax cavernicola]